MEQTQSTISLSRPDRFSTQLALALLILAALVHLVIPFWALAWSQLPFPGFMVEQTLLINDRRGTGWPLKETLPSFGHILAVDGTPVRTPAEFLDQMAARSRGDLVNLTVEQEVTRIQITVPVRLTAFPQQDMMLMFWLPYLVGILFLLLGGWVYWLRGRQAAGRVFTMFCALTSVSTSLVFDLGTSTRLNWLWTLSLPLSASAMISLGLIFPQETRLTRRRPPLRWLPAVPGLLIGLGNQVPLYSRQDPWAYIPAWQLSYILGAAALLFFLGMMAYRRIWAQFPLAREQSRVILWGSFIAFAPLATWMVRASFIRTPTGFSALYVLPILVFPAATAYAIQRYRLLDTDRLVRRGTVYALLSALVVLATILLVNLSSFLLGAVVSLDDPLVIALLTTALVILFNPLRTRLQTLVDRMFYRQEQDYQHRLQRFSHLMTTAVELDYIINAIYSAVARALQPQSKLLYLHDRSSDAYRPPKTNSAPPLLAGSPLIRYLYQDRGLLFLGDYSRLPAPLASSQEMLMEMGANIVAPIRGSRNLTGVLVVGPTISGRPYSKDDIAFLETLADQASLALERAQVLQQMADRAQQLAMLNQAGRSLTSTLELDPLLHIIMEKAAEVLQAKAGSLLLHDEQAGELIFKVCIGPGASILEGSRIPANKGLVGATITERRSIIVHHAQQDTRWFQEVDKQTAFITRSILTAPLIAKTKVIGVLELLNKRNRLPFNAEDQELATAFAAQATLAIENAQLYTQTDQSLAQRVHELTMLHDLDRTLNDRLDFDWVIGSTLDWVMRASKASAGGIGLVEQEAKGVRVLALQGYQDNSLAVGDLWPLDAGITARSIRTGQPSLEPDVHQDPDYIPANPSTQSQLTVPITREGRVIGIIVLESDVTAGFNEETLAMVVRVADHAAVAIDNARLYQESQRWAEDMALLYDIGLTVTSHLALDGVLAAVYQRIREVWRPPVFFIALYNEAEDALEFAIYIDRGEQLEPFSQTLAEKPGFSAWIVHHRRPLLIRDWQEEAETSIVQGIPVGNDITRSWLGVPLIAGDRMVGVMTVQDYAPNAYGKEHKRLLSTIASEVAIAIENARLYQETQLRLRELSLLFDTSAAVSTSLDVDRVLHTTARHITSALAADGCTIYIWDREQDALVNLLDYSDDLDWWEPEAPGTLYPLADYPVSRRMLNNRQPLVIQASDLNADPAELAWMTNEEIRTLLMVPMVVRDEVIGVLELMQAHQERVFSPTEVRLCQTLATQAAAALENARLFESVQKANQAKSEFVSMVSHELKTPMTSIRGYADLLLSGRSGELNEVQNNFLNTIQANVSRMKRLVNDLADISRIETGQLSIEKHPIPFDMVVEQVLHTMRGLCQEKGLELVLEAPASVPRLEGDPTRLGQALTNLVSNAYKYTPAPGRVTITVSAGLVELGERGMTDCVICAVQDTGIGIPADEQEKLFSKFFRSGQQVVRETPGTGLGLVITKSLIEMHGGKLWLQSKVGVGSTFTFAIPRLARKQ